MYTEVATSFIPPHLTRHHSNNSSSQYNFLHLLIAIVFYGRLLFLFPLFLRQKCLRNICFHDQKESVCLLSQKHSSTSILKNISTVGSGFGSNPKHPAELFWLLYKLTSWWWIVRLSSALAMKCYVPFDWLLTGLPSVSPYCSSLRSWRPFSTPKRPTEAVNEERKNHFN